MKNRTPDTLLSQLSEFIAARTALHFPMDRWSDLERRVNSAAEEFGFTDKTEFIQWITSSSLTREQIEILSSHLTITETYFWRESRIFDALQGQILPELIRSQEKGEKRLRIWSAGCATGEEPYSIAIALRRAIPFQEGWRITILATDINPRILRKAMAGVYGKWSFRNAPAWLKKEYFRPRDGGMFEIIPEIRKMVTFEYMNLAEDIYPSPLNNTSAMDIIFCRNVLMYFAPENSRQIINKIYHCLVDGGWLMVGASELSHQMFTRFRTVHFPEAIAYQKVSQSYQSPVVFPFEDMVTRQVSARSSLEIVDKVFSEKENIIVKHDQTPIDIKPIKRKEDVEMNDKSEEDKCKPFSIADSIRALANRGELDEALALCEKAIASDKLDPGMHYLRAIILQEQNSYAEAIASVKRALYLKADSVLANFVLGNLMVRGGNRRAGKRYFNNVLALLSKYGHEEILPESGGLTAGRLAEIIRATQSTYNRRMTRDE
jgi:chemotaxis protein methyltransferase CheR